jgi:uncharacterized protein
MIVVSDTSPISALLKIGEVQLLKQLFGEVIIPVAVQNELLRAHSNLPLWVRVVSVQNLISAAKFRALVDAGEAEAIQLAKELRADRILIDDHKGLRAIGLVGVIALAKKKGMITSARKVVSDLQVRAHVYVAQAIIDAVLKELGE